VYLGELSWRLLVRRRGLDRCDDASIFKGTFLLAWCWFRTGLSRTRLKYRVFFSKRDLAINTTSTRQECKYQFARAGPTAHRSVGPGDSIEESETRLQFTVEHRMKTNSCRSILCIILGSAGCYDSACVTTHGVKKLTERENVLSD
jgi:hypothetical protein